MIKHLTEQEYDALEALNVSRLANFSKSPLHYKQNFFKESDAMKLGTLVHMALLEPDLFRERVVLEPEFWGMTRDGKPSKQSADARAKKQAWRDAQHPEALIMDQAESDAIAGMLGSITSAIADPRSGMAGLMGGQNEVSCVREMFGRPCKGMADSFIVNHPKLGKTVVDLKKVGKPFGAHPDHFKRDVFSLDYDAKAFWYKELFQADNFIWIVVEEKAPHPVAIYNAASFMSIGERKVRRWIETLERCEKEDYWPSYTNGIEDLHPSDWARREEESI